MLKTKDNTDSKEYNEFKRVTIPMITALGITCIVLFLLPYSEDAKVALVSAIFAISMFLIYQFPGYIKLKEMINKGAVEEIKLQKNFTRILIDVLISMVISVGLVFYLSTGLQVGRWLVIIGLMTVIYLPLKKILNYLAAKMFFDKEKEALLILSPFQSLEVPLRKLNEMRIEEKPDILKLHPLLSIFSGFTDYTTSLSSVIYITFPGASFYFTPLDTKKTASYLSNYSNKKERIDVVAMEKRSGMPNIKRAFGKAYFAIAMQDGIYILMALISLIKPPFWLSLVILILWSLFNLAISDEILSIVMDAKEVKDGEIYKLAKKIFNRVGISSVRLFVTDTPMRNALATGMNIGRGRITLTSSILSMPSEAVEAIIAHESVHVKKRDNFWKQIIVASPYMFFMLAILNR